MAGRRLLPGSFKNAVESPWEKNFRGLFVYVQNLNFGVQVLYKEAKNEKHTFKNCNAEIRPSRG